MADLSVGVLIGTLTGYRVLQCKKGVHFGRRLLTSHTHIFPDRGNGHGGMEDRLPDSERNTDVTSS